MSQNDISPAKMMCMRDALASLKTLYGQNLPEGESAAHSPGERTKSSPCGSKIGSLERWTDRVSWSMQAYEAVVDGLVVRKAATIAGSVLEQNRTPTARESIWLNRADDRNGARYGEVAQDFCVYYAKALYERRAHTELKFHLAYLFAKAAGQDELPPRPKGLAESRKSGILGSGWIYLACHKLMQYDKAGSMEANEGSRGWTRLVERLNSAQDVLYSKVAFPPLPELEVDDVQAEQFRTLCDRSRTEEPPEHPAIKRVIREVVSKLLANWNCREAINLTPSTGASVGSGRKSGGAAGELASTVLKYLHKIPLSEEAREVIRKHFLWDAGVVHTDLNKIATILGCREKLSCCATRLDANRCYSPPTMEEHKAYLRECRKNHITPGVTTEEFQRLVRLWTPPMGFSEYELRLKAIALTIQPALTVTDCEGNFELICAARFDGYTTEAVESLANSAIADETGLYQSDPACGSPQVVGPPVRLCPILEPLKVRTVSCGVAALYSRAQTIQVELWNRLKNWESFQLIGRPLDSETLNSVFGRFAYSREMFANSGDYTAATNNLDPRLTEFCADEIAKQYRRKEQGPDVVEERAVIKNILYMCLTCHTVLVEKDLKQKWSGQGQVWGQLMGSPVSFPILNIVNFSATFAALRDYNPKLRLCLRRGVGGACAYQKVYGDDRCIMTNGDDILFFCTKEEYVVWQRFVKAAGLSPSIGKNYLSQDFMMINSELRTIPRNWFSPWIDLTKGYKAYPVFIESGYEGTLYKVCIHPEDRRWKKGVCQRPGRWHAYFSDTSDLSGLFLSVTPLEPTLNDGLPIYRPYVNLGLLRAVERKGPDAGKSMLNKLAYPELGPRACALTYGFSEPTRSGLIRKFVHNHRSILARVPLGCGWHIGSSLGGVGIPPPLGHVEGDLNLYCAREVASGLHRSDLLIPPLCVQAQSWADAALSQFSGGLCEDGALKYVPFGHSDSAQRIPSAGAKNSCPCPYFALWLGKLAAGWDGGPLPVITGGAARERLSGLERAWKQLRKKVSFKGTLMSQERAWRYGSGFWLRESAAKGDLPRVTILVPPSGYGCVNPDVTEVATANRSVTVRTFRECCVTREGLFDESGNPLLLRC